MNMQLDVSATTIDLVVGLYLFVQLIIGYQRGLFARLYDLLSTILVFIGAFACAKPLSNNITFYRGTSDLVDSLLAPMLNYLISLIVLILLFFLIKVLLGHILKPLFLHLKQSSHIASLVGGLLGMGLSAIKSLFVLYIALAIIIPTIFTNGTQKIAETSYAHYIVDVLPSYRGNLNLLSDTQLLDGRSEVTDTKMLSALLRMSLTSYSLHVISEKQMLDLINQNFASDILKYGATLNTSEKETLQTLLNNTSFSSEKQKQILSKIQVGDQS